MKIVHVVFIRHAESEENVKVQHFMEAVQRLKQFRLPTYQQITQSARLLELDTDAKLSPLGQRQIMDMSRVLKDSSFWDNFHFDICAYSPLERARLTCFGLIPPDLQEKCLPLDALREIEPYEHLLSSKLKTRFHDLEIFLKRQGQENKEYIVLVGHSRYFGKLLNMPALMRNCDVWQGSFTFDPSPDSHSSNSSSGTGGRSGGGTWSTPKLLFRTPLATSHPVDSLFSWSSRASSADAAATAQLSSSSATRIIDDDLQPPENDEEPFCRICQARQSETPSLRFLRPCLCAGSLAYVHIDCLNQWRATSEVAYRRCTVCSYEYRVHASWLSDWLLHPLCLVTLCVITSLLVSYSLGYFAYSLLQSDYPSLFLTNLYKLYNQQTSSSSSASSSFLTVSNLCLYLGLPPELVMINNNPYDNNSYRPYQCRSVQNLTALGSILTRLLRHGKLSGCLHQLWKFLACSSSFTYSIQLLVLGCSLFGCFAQVYHYSIIFRRLLRHHWPQLRLGQQQQEDNGQQQQEQMHGMLGFVSIWICNDLRYSLRLFILFGIFQANYYCYIELSRLLRQYSHDWLGQHVMDAPPLQHSSAQPPPTTAAPAS